MFFALSSFYSQKSDALAGAYVSCAKDAKRERSYFLKKVHSLGPPFCDGDTKDYRFWGFKV